MQATMRSLTRGRIFQKVPIIFHSSSYLYTFAMNRHAHIESNFKVSRFWGGRPLGFIFNRKGMECVLFFGIYLHEG